MSIDQLLSVGGILVAMGGGAMQLRNLSVQVKELGNRLREVELHLAKLVE